MKTLAGFVTFGNLKYTQIAVDSVARSDVDLFAVVGKPGDAETVKWLEARNIPHVVHTENLGFPYSLNDIYDHAWVNNNYDYLIVMGNDIYSYPGTIESLIKCADTTDYEIISGLQYDVRDLYADFEGARQYIDEDTYTIKDLSSKVWKLFTGDTGESRIADMKLYDIQNLCLYKKSVFDKIGYTDVNFYPAYFIDNDYANRIVHAGIQGCSLMNARFFHFWSRTIKEETGGSTHEQFRANEDYYVEKWGGKVGEETRIPELSILSREGELEQISKWK